jgi:hypothetical protein
LKCNGKTFSIGDYTNGCADAGRNTKTNNVFMRERPIDKSMLEEPRKPHMLSWKNI